MHIIYITFDIRLAQPTVRVHKYCSISNREQNCNDNFAGIFNIDSGILIFKSANLKTCVYPSSIAFKVNKLKTLKVSFDYVARTSQLEHSCLVQAFLQFYLNCLSNLSGINLLVSISAVSTVKNTGSSRKAQHISKNHIILNDHFWQKI